MSGGAEEGEKRGAGVPKGRFNSIASRVPYLSSRTGGAEWGGGPLTIAAELGLGAAGERGEGGADAADGWWLDDTTRTHAARTHARSRGAMAVGGRGRGYEHAMAWYSFYTTGGGGDTSARPEASWRAQTPAKAP